MSESQQTQQNQTNQTATNQQAQKPKKTRTRKTIEQELAELEARRQRLLETKRKAEAHDKIVFGATVIAMLKEMKGRGDKNCEMIARTIYAFTAVHNPKEFETIEKIVEQTTGFKPEKRPQKQG